jgi:hypothetical protein
MRDESQPEEMIGSERAELQSRNVGQNRDLDRRFYTALWAYAVLGALAWFTLGEGSVFVAGRPVELRLLPLLVLGGFALRTVVARQAEKIRRDEKKASDQGPVR